MLRPAFYLPIIALLACCKSSKQQTPSPSSSPTPLVELATTACFGFCPVYTITIFQNGAAKYVGKQFCALEGEFSFQCTADELARLKKSVSQANLHQYPDRIPSNVADAPGAILRVFDRDSAKSVSGSIDRPQPLLDLENLIKDIGTAHGLELRRGVNPDDPSRANRRQLSVQFDEKINAGNWVNEYKYLGLQLVRRIGEPNRWLVSYDAGKTSEQEMMKQIRQTPGVVSIATYKPGPDGN